MQQRFAIALPKFPKSELLAAALRYRTPTPQNSRIPHIPKSDRLNSSPE
ncbi:MAG: hypothetical protein PX483_13825 [Nostocales cyanobacterium LE14-WE4]|nr:hypothetical protein [Nostocales cyanobacterium LE14-WE4]